MHERSNTELEKLSVKAMEEHFIRSTEGKPFAQEYDQLYRQKEIVKKLDDELWSKAEQAFMGYLRNA